jgi:serine protease inhibitor
MTKYTFHFVKIDKIISASADTATEAMAICYNGLSQSDQENTEIIEIIEKE